MASDATTFRTFFGDRERVLKLNPNLAMELERATGTGISTLSKRVFGAQFYYRDLTETIRLGLIGGGETPERAAELIRTYVTDRPLSEVVPLAAGVLSALMLGSKPDEATPDDA
ncbi:gene transfer agent family protein [Hyphomicrobium sp. MC1]|uniref:gene transfer agent family protein n=1 Tax=Hyphomicrobium sp. (strain MC1) TaxID=717785 RepID=UPI000317E4F2|nr:gene transfer agent family protein [Hyphomicrobium sp. MC1]